MNFVPIKQVEQQDIQSLHRVRTRVVKNRTALINEIRGLSLEYGVVIAPGAAKVKLSLCTVIAESANELAPSSRECMQDLYEELVDVELRLKRLDTRIRQLCRQSTGCQRVLKIPGVGELTATAIVAAVPNPKEFRLRFPLLSGDKLICQHPKRGYHPHEYTFYGPSELPISLLAFRNPHNRLARKVVKAITVAEMMAARIGVNHPALSKIARITVLAQNPQAEINRNRRMDFQGSPGIWNVQI